MDISRKSSWVTELTIGRAVSPWDYHFYLTDKLWLFRLEYNLDPPSTGGCTVTPASSGGISAPQLTQEAPPGPWEGAALASHTPPALDLHEGASGRQEGVYSS